MNKERVQLDQKEKKNNGSWKNKAKKNSLFLSTNAMA